MREKKLTEIQINYNVLNGLNLYSEELGADYLAKGINPLGENFILTEAYILERIANKMHLPKEIINPDFINAGVKQTRLAFLNSINNCQALLNQIEELLNNPAISEYEKEKLRKLKLYLVLRIQLLNKYVKNIKKDKNTTKMMENITALDGNLAKSIYPTFSPQENLSLADYALMIKESLKAMDALGKIVEEQSKMLEDMAKTIIIEGKEVVQDAVQSTKKAVKETAKVVKDIAKAPIEAVKNLSTEPQPEAEEYVLETKVTIKEKIVIKETTTEPKTKKAKHKEDLSR